MYSGIGLGIAEHFAKLGANIVLNGFGDNAEINNVIKVFYTHYISDP